MFALFETLLRPTDTPEHPEPPAGLIAFFWHFARQAKWLFVALFVVELFVALTDSAVPWFMGRIVTLVTTVPPDRFLAATWPMLAGMALVVLVARPFIALLRYLITNQAIAAPFTSLIRWQAHWHVVRQSWAFFQNDFAGRISTRVMQTGPAVRSTLTASVTALWYILAYGATAIGMTASADPWLATPLLLWFAGYVALLAFFVPRMRDRSKVNSEARSALTGRIVDSYTNILTVKLFARASDEDRYVRDAIDRHTGLFLAAQRLMTVFGTLLHVLNALLIAGAGALALLLWQRGAVEVGTIAMVLPLTLQLTNMSRQIAMQITEIFEDIGVVQEGMITIAQPLRLIDSAGAQPLVVREGRIAFEDVRFGYGRETGVLEGFSLAVPPGDDTVLAAVKALPGSAGACSVVGGMAPLKMPRTDEHRGRFQKGWRGGPGRPKGVPDRSRADLSQLINPSPPSGWIGDLHLQAVDHARHTRKTLPAGGAQGRIVWVALGGLAFLEQKLYRNFRVFCGIEMPYNL
jgi:ATP-binding cassette subfamily B multidrug efflux pump